TPTADNTKIVAETKCDSDIVAGVQADNDCDGRIDEAQSNLGAACDNGMQGICRGTGSYVCDTTTRSNPATCKIMVPGQTAGTETCDGLDNNCNGQIDEGASTGTLAGINWSTIPNTTPPIQIMKYEASRPNANGTTLGTITDHVCSRDTVQPWTNLTQPEAEAACSTIGARLCSEAEWQTMCLPTTIYPVSAPTTTDPTFAFIEAEDYLAKTDLGGHPWTRIAPAGLNGVTAMQVPDSGFAQGVAASALTQSSRLDYQLDVTATGNYYVWLHMRSPTPSSAPNVFGTHTPPAATLVPSSDSTTAIGDIVIVTTWTTSTAAVTHTVQSGFTAINTQAYDEGSAHARLSVAYKVATAAGTQPYQAYTAAGGTTTSYSSVTIIRANTVTMASLSSAVTSSNNNSDSSGKLNPPAPTTPTVPSLVLAIGAYAGGQGTITAPSNFTEQWQMSNATSTTADIALASRTATATNQTDPGSFTAGFTRTGGAAMTISIPLSVSGNSNSVWVGMTAGTTAGDASGTAVTTAGNEEWEWRVTPAFNVAANGKQTFSIYVKDDGLIVDTIAVSRQNTTGPTIDNVWAYQNNPRTSQPNVCNNDGYDTSTAAGDQDDILPTATLPMCFANHADITTAGDTDAYDMSGNVKEWTAARTAGQNPIRGGASNNEEAGTSCKSSFTLADDQFFFPNVGFRCCRLKP
ncbi:MAG TPA: MopE-related protein, partial [Kofleriaceae bacterium]